MNHTLDTNRTKQIGKGSYCGSTHSGNIGDIWLKPVDFALVDMKFVHANGSEA